MVFRANNSSVSKSFAVLRGCLIALIVLTALDSIAWILFAFSAWEETREYRGVFDSVVSVTRSVTAIGELPIWIIMGVACLPSRMLSRTLWISVCFFAQGFGWLASALYAIANLVKETFGLQQAQLESLEGWVATLVDPLYTVSLWLAPISTILLVVVLFVITFRRGRARWLGFLYLGFALLPVFTGLLSGTFLERDGSGSFTEQSVHMHDRFLYITGILAQMLWIGLLVLVVKNLRSIVALQTGVCERCLRSFDGLSADTCPECGTAFGDPSK